ncbi:MAG: hypothetical protein GVY04_21260 [Cyanobacteria bacterium]|jgi:hypothetical protein|nr:hypothetical protein [Cyanobacteria bacterium GSL.Bin1]
MIISNLSYLEAMPEDTKVQGGFSNLNAALNLATVGQGQLGKGNIQSVAIGQTNVIENSDIFLTPSE